MKYLPGNKYLSKSLVVAMVLVQFFAFASMPALAAPPQPAVSPYDAKLTEQDIRAQFGLSGDVEVLTDSEMSQLIELCHQIGAYLVQQDDGTLVLQLDDPDLVGVDEAFLENYRVGLAEINELIKRGWIVLDEDLQLSPGPELPVDPGQLDAGLTEIENQVAGAEAVEALPAGDDLAYGGSGFLFSFHSGRHHVPYHYASLGPTFASTSHYGRYGGRYSLLFGLNRGFLYNTYRYGGYGYVPYYQSYHYGYSPYYYYPYHSSYYYGRWYYRYLYY